MVNPPSRSDQHGKHHPQDTCRQQRRQQCLADPAGGRRPERFLILERLAARHAEGRRRRPRRRCPATSPRRPAANPNETAVRAAAASTPNDAGEQHDRRERPAVNGGTFHQRADGLQVFIGPIRFPCQLLCITKSILASAKFTVWQALAASLRILHHLICVVHSNFKS